MKKTAALLVLLTLPVFADTWDKNNDPRIFDDNYEYRLSALPLKSILPKDKTPWSSSFWPRKKGSINYRWNSAHPNGFKLNSPSRLTLQRMSSQQIAELSPAEKFDLAQGHYNYPLSSRVAANATKKAKDYEGVCDGWTASAIQFSEPAPVEIRNPDGIMIPFGTSDVKALMSYDVSINAERGSLGPVFIGGYCSAPLGMSMGLGNCKDINAGAFHVVLANQIGLKKQSFAADVDPGKETWNQPVYGYEFNIVEETRADGAARAYVVHAKFMYAEDDVEGNENPLMKVFTWLPTVGTPAYAATTMELDYVIELDYSGRIIGGSWLGASKRNHPDLFWMPTNKIQWTPEFSILNQIYKASF